MPGRVVSSASRTFSSAVYRLRRSRPVMTSTRSTGFDIGERLGPHVAPGVRSNWGALQERIGLWREILGSLRLGPVNRASLKTP